MQRNTKGKKIMKCCRSWVTGAVAQEPANRVENMSILSGDPLKKETPVP